MDAHSMHRFYNNTSSYTHGDSQPAVGKRDIYNRIQQLNFRDCQANINRVDVQATPGDGVVLQVSGELSNDGQPMRRFFQTFVLAAQSSKKYYVQNDICSYQDLGLAEEQDQSKESLKKPEIHMVNQSVQVGGNIVSLIPDLIIENEQDRNKKQVEKPVAQMVDQAVQLEGFLVSYNQDLGREEKEDQIEEHVEKSEQIQMVDQAVQIVCEMLSKYSQPEQIDAVTTCSAATQTVEAFLERQVNLSPPQLILKSPLRTSPIVPQTPRKTPGGLKKSVQLIEQRRQEQSPLTCILEKEIECRKSNRKFKPNSTSSSSRAVPDKVLPQQQLLFSETIGGQVGEAQTITNGNKRYGKHWIRLEFEISIYLVDRP
ncbi:ras GTPase-activating protein-binding protein 1-like isoform X1 [Drosophila serrata]|uniref:ras GTPase-activating protein-binding protein 1-like isoform X1 n=1 Tax=Drosophila serrata TaxID=7274 RepID=UPI000A1D39CE|nr:ras GTPase-activating protein-binding protein 1-like isoform X1 [Drosophila serrata]